MNPNPTSSLGRFKVLKVLGQGLQGRVYLALDTQLQREVAVKLVLNETKRGRGESTVPTEALHLAKLRHPNVVSVFEIGFQGTIPYLVCEYIEGGNLRQLIAEEGAIAFPKALRILTGILDGMAYAHGQGIVHLDLSPGNIMIDRDGVARVMDFGLSGKGTVRTPKTGGVVGTLPYMSPEHFTGRPLDARTDVYALALIAYELLTGKRANAANRAEEFVRRGLVGDLDFSEAMEVDATGQLGLWLRTAAQREPDQRYADARAMREALLACSTVRTALSGSATPSAHTTVEFLLWRMQRKQDFPALSRTLMEINRLTDNDEVPLKELVTTVLCDYAVTNKLLKLANSAFYGNAGRSVKNVSDAIRVLGLDKVRQACNALLCFQQFQGGLQDEELVDALASSFVAGLVARHLAPRMGVQDAEQAFICGLFQGLGRSLAIYYFPEEHQDVKRLVTEGERTWPEAQVDLLGVTYGELGRAVARTWGYPEVILSSMAPRLAGAVAKPQSAAEGLFQIAAFSNRLCGLDQQIDAAARERRLAALVEQFQTPLALDPEQAASVLGAAAEKFRQIAPVLELPILKNSFVERVALWLRVRAENTSVDQVTLST